MLVPRRFLPESPFLTRHYAKVSDADFGVYCPQFEHSHIWDRKSIVEDWLRDCQGHQKDPAELPTSQAEASPLIYSSPASSTVSDSTNQPDSRHMDGQSQSTPAMLGFQGPPRPLPNLQSFPRKSANPNVNSKGSAAGDDIPVPPKTNPTTRTEAIDLFPTAASTSMASLGQNTAASLESVRKDLVGVNPDHLRGPLRQIAKQNNSPTSNTGAGGTSMRTNPRKQVSIDGTAMTVSPQEAFLDYNDVTAHTPKTSANAASMFAPLESLTGSTGNPSVTNFEYPPASAKWLPQDQSNVNNLPQVSSASDMNFVDYFANDDQNSQSAQNTGTFTNPSYALDPALAGITEMGRQSYRAKAPAMLSSNGMPLLSRAAEESYMFNHRNNHHMGSLESASGSEASQPVSPNDSFSSYSDSGRTPGSAGNWLSGRPPMPSPAIDLKGERRDLNFDSQNQGLQPQTHNNGQLPSSLLPPTLQGDQQPQEQDSSLRSTFNTDDSFSYPSADGSSRGDMGAPEVLARLKTKSMVPKRKRPPQVPPAPMPSSYGESSSIPLPSTSNISGPEQPPVAGTFERTRPSYREFSHSDGEVDSGDDDYDPSGDFDGGDIPIGQDGPAPAKRRRKSAKNAGGEGSAGPSTPTSRQPGSASSSRTANATPGSSIRCEHVDPVTGKVCGVSFRRPYDLARHRETIHVQNSEKPVWSCKACNHQFSRKDALLRHQRLRGHR